MTMSLPVLSACSQPANATLAGSVPLGFVTMSQPSRWLQSVNCSTAAARNVSPAASTTELPVLIKNLASFAIDVVLPAPFTPATRMTIGFVDDIFKGESGFSTSQLELPSPRNRLLSLSLTVCQIASMSTVRPRCLSRSSSRIASVATTPMSVRSRRFSNSTSFGSSRISPALSRSRMSVCSSCLVFARPAFSLSKKPMIRSF